MPFSDSPRFEALHHFEQRVLALPDDDDVDIFGGERLIRQQRGMPAAQDDRQIADRGASPPARSATVSRIIGPVTSETHRQSASCNSSSTRCWKFGVIVESMMRT